MAEVLTNLDIANDVENAATENAASKDNNDNNDKVENEPMPVPSTCEALHSIQLQQLYLSVAVYSDTAQEHLQAIEHI